MITCRAIGHRQREKSEEVIIIIIQHLYSAIMSYADTIILGQINDVNAVNCYGFGS